MRKPILLILGLTIFAASLPALDLRLGPVASFSGVQALEVIFEGPIDWVDEDLRPEFGFEAGLRGSRYQLLVPVGLMWESRLENGWSWGASVHALAGASQQDAGTGFLWGGEAELRSEWSWSPGIGLALGAGVRYLGNGWEFPFHTAVEFSFGEEDTLEPVEEKDR